MFKQKKFNNYKLLIAFRTFQTENRLLDFLLVTNINHQKFNEKKNIGKN